MPSVEKIIEKMKRQPNGIRPEEADKVLRAYGYEGVRQKGSHMQFKHKVNKNKITVPYHSKQDLNINVIKSIEEHTNLKILKKLNKKKNKINKEEL